MLSHYQTNIVPQVEALIDDRVAERNLIIEGSALYPKFIYHLLNKPEIRGIWLTASGRLLTARILRASNFNNVDKSAQYLIEKFLARTLLYNQSLQQDILSLGLKSIELEQDCRGSELIARCLDFNKGDG